MDSYSSFCNCEYDIGYVQCNCGEEFDVNEWSWEEIPQNTQVRLSRDNREVLFHPGYSLGTAAVRGNIPLTPGRQYLWEIKMISFIHGTDVVVGIGTSQVNLTAHSQKFVTLLGSDSESWGFSYKGEIIHAGNRTSYGPPFGKGSIVGVHLNMWTGSLEFYLNRQRLGVAFRIKKNTVLFPMICSTMGNSTMRLVNTMSWPASLELSCLQAISSMPELSEIPGLRAVWGKTLWWRQATEKKKVEDHLSPDEVEYDLEIISSDEEEQERILLRSRRVPRNRQARPK